MGKMMEDHAFEKLRAKIDQLELKKQTDISLQAVTSADDVCVAFFRMKKVRNQFVYSQMKKMMVDKEEKWISAITYDVVKRSLSGLYDSRAMLITLPVLERLTALLIEHRAQIRGPIFIVEEHLFTEILGQFVNQCQRVISLITLRVQSDLAPLLKNPGPCLVFDNVRSADNIGSILRTAFSFGLTTVICTKISFPSIDARSVRVSMGALLHFHIYVVDDIATIIAELKHQFHFIGTSPQGPVPLSSLRRPEKPWALILGNEKNVRCSRTGECCSQQGSKTTTLEVCDDVVHIEQKQGDSLSVVSAGAICVYVLATLT